MILLNSVLTKAKEKYPVGLSDDKVFEFYCADNILINYDLDHVEIESGIIDGPRDAGIDAAYIFVNTQLLTDDFKFTAIRQPVEIELFLIQSKNQDSFKEGAIDKLASSLPLLLDYAKSPKDLEPLFKKEVVEKCHAFLDAIERLAEKFPKVAIKLFYCSKAIEPNVTAKAKATALEATLKGMQFSNVSFTFLGGQQLYERSANQKRLVAKLSVSGTPLSGANSYVALCKLTDYVKFISDDDGNLITRIFEANVRAYQGEVEVNREIAASLEVPTPGIDFWWLNNGVTVVADESSFTNNQLVIANPLIVNGLQTSHEIHVHTTNLPIDSQRVEDQRSILIRVINETDPIKRDKIIRATNRQTSITSSSFRATEQVHREIEDYLLTLGYYYDRRKNSYKREGKPVDKIISIDRLAQAVLAVLLKEPHSARARPTTVIKDEENYKRIFSGDKTQQPLEMYGVIVKMLTAVEDFFRLLSSPDERIYRNNMKFHALMVLGWALNGGTTLPALRLPHLDLTKVTSEQLEAVARWVFSEFQNVGAEDKIAKQSAFTDHLISKWNIAATAV